MSSSYCLYSSWIFTRARGLRRSPAYAAYFTRIQCCTPSCAATRCFPALVHASPYRDVPDLCAGAHFGEPRAGSFGCGIAQWTRAHLHLAPYISFSLCDANFEIFSELSNDSPSPTHAGHAARPSLSIDPRPELIHYSAHIFSSLSHILRRAGVAFIRLIQAARLSRACLHCTQ